MTRLIETLRCDRDRHRAAALRLRDARRHFDLSTAALRRAALDHIVCHRRASAILRATLHRLAAQAGTPL